MAKLYYQGHASLRLTADDGTVIYIDPYAGDGYDLPADLILITHEHTDHNQSDIAAQKRHCLIIRAADALKDGLYQQFTVGSIQIEAVPAYNRNHDKNKCVGYVLSFDGIKLYAAGDTSTTDAMGGPLREMGLDYALLPTDGVYNMNAREASKCAELIGARHTIPIHMKPGALFDRRAAEKLRTPSRLIVAAGEEIPL
ncbi:MAG: MBL fold metallo-hydrolase [Provencibacterium sp.]|jgi:L-ascorbate metabolism protein UlaG (beta-lactamase superfamily)|nr:MBL fold metallo-hydrolase [Provencibacterium sp.]